jgi:hypothetical protein
MPVNMNPRKRRTGKGSEDPQAENESRAEDPGQPKAQGFGEETEEDREKAAADAEWKNLWDATEVIDMDTF